MSKVLELVPLERPWTYDKAIILKEWMQKEESFTLLLNITKKINK